MLCSNVDTNCKVIVVGNGEVGKSSMLHWYCKGEFTEDYKKTIGMFTKDTKHTRVRNISCAVLGLQLTPRE